MEEIIIPYIDAESRKQIKLGRPPLTAGELNYILCIVVLSGCLTEADLMQICMSYIGHTKCDYQHMNDVVGALDGAFREIIRRTGRWMFILPDTKRRFQRKVVAPYEDRKIRENGDIEVITNIIRESK